MGSVPGLGASAIGSAVLGPAGALAGVPSFLGAQSGTAGPLAALTGTAGGVGGTGIQGPSSANITNPVTADQISNSYTGTQNGLQSQQQLLAALQGQNGLANQNQVYGQLQGVANGTGPNPAQAMLNQSTGQNVANQAALMAGQRGAGANAGLIARQAAMQGANTQQQAAGQAATLQANQSLNAINSAGGLANTQASNQIGQTNANTQAQQAEQNSLLGAQSGFNTAETGSQGSVNAGNAAIADTTLKGQQGLVGGALNGIGAGLGMLAGGGVVGDQSAFTGPQSKFGQFLTGVSNQSQQNTQNAQKLQTPDGQLEAGTSSAVSGLMGALSRPGSGDGSTGEYAGSFDEGPTGMGTTDVNGSGMDAYGNDSGLTLMSAKGGEVPVIVSPGEKYLSPQDVQKVQSGANPMKVGQTIPGKAPVGGAKNSYSNDIVPMKAQSGGIVVPRSETQSKDPDKASADFVHRVLAKRRAGGK